MKENSFFHEFDGEEIQEGLFANGKHDVIYKYEDGKVYSIAVSKCFQGHPGYIRVDLELPWRQNGIYQICEQDLKESRAVI